MSAPNTTYYQSSVRQSSAPRQYSNNAQFSTNVSMQGYPEGSTQTGMRRVQSVVIGEEYLQPLPQESVRYIEVPYVEEVIRHVPKKEIVQIEKRVPRLEIEYVERIVDVPQIQYVDKHVEVPQVQEVIRHVPRREVVEVPKEVIRRVPKIETKIVEKVVEVCGEIIEVPKPYTVENKVPVPHYVDSEVPMVVAQTLKPVLAESNKHVDVDVIEYEPELISVDIHVPKAVPTQVISMGVVDEIHRLVNVPPAQYNSMLRFLNPHIQDGGALPYQQQDGAIQFSNENISHVAALPGVEIQGWTRRSADAHDASTSSTTTTSRQSKRSSKHGADRQVRPRGHSALSYPKGSTLSSKQLQAPKKRGKGACPC